MEKISYSKLDTFIQCGYKYRLVYVDKHFIEQSSIATSFGTLIHFIEETIANKLKAKEHLDYNKLLDLFYNVEDKKEKLFGVNILKKLYPEDFYVKDKNGLSYQDKVEIYVDSGICRLEDYLTANPNLEIFGAEIPFDFIYQGYQFHGFIDRVFKNIENDSYIIEDIKTYSAPLDLSHLRTPLQFVIYTAAFSEMLGIDQEKISCAYDLPLCLTKQEAGTKGFIKRGFEKIDKSLSLINDKTFVPHPTALCHWCIFSKTYPNQPEEAKHLCPYFSHWTKENKTQEVENEWMGEENHPAILEAFIDSENNELNLKPEINVKEKLITTNERKFTIRW